MQDPIGASSEDGVVTADPAQPLSGAQSGGAESGGAQNGRANWGAEIAEVPGIDVSREDPAPVPTMEDATNENVHESEPLRYERLFRRAMDGAPQGMAVIGLDLMFLEVNTALCVLLGRDEEWLLAHSVADVMNPADAELDRTSRGELLSGEGSPTRAQEYRWLKSDGSELWVLQSSGLLLDENDLPMYYVSHVQDVTETRAAREELARYARYERMFRLAMDGAPQGMAVVGLDLKFVEVNAALCAMVGRDEQWMLAHCVPDVMSPADAELDRGGRGELLTGPAGETQVRERRWLKADGSELWVLHSTGLLRNERNLPMYYVSHVQEITEARAAREELARHATYERMFRLAMDGAPQGMAVVGLDLKFVEVNDALCRMLDRDQEWLLTHSVTDVMSEDAAERDRSGRDELLSGAAETQVAESRWLKSDGSQFWVLHSRGLLRDEQTLPLYYVSHVQDISDSRRAREELARFARYERMFRLAMNAAPQGMAVVGLDLKFVEVNPALCDMLGRDEQWLLAHSVPDVMSPDDAELDRAGRAELLSGAAETQVHELRWLKSDGSELWVLHSTGLLRDDQAMPSYYVSHVQDTTSAHRSTKQLTHQASHDALTGLINRRELEYRLSTLITQTQRKGGVVGVLFCDLDLFKEVNDTHGHASGDEVLRVVAERIASARRATDLVARVGGDEFVVVLADVLDIAAAQTIGQDIVRRVHAPITIDDIDVCLSVSVGIALDNPDSHIDPALLMSQADEALYEAKRLGRNRIATFDPAKPEPHSTPRNVAPSDK